MVGCGTGHRSSSLWLVDSDADGSSTGFVLAQQCKQMRRACKSDIFTEGSILFSSPSDGKRDSDLSRKHMDDDLYM